MDIKCKNCKIGRKVLKSKTPACCKWYMDNIVCGWGSTKNCPLYKKTKVKKG